MTTSGAKARAQRRLLAVAAARACVGTPFLHQGRNYDSGLDCVGLIVVAAQALGLSVPHRADYGRQPEQARLVQEMAMSGLVPTAVADRTPGDILVFQVGRYPRHLALMSDKGMIHAWAQTGRVVEHGLAEDWLSRLVSVFRFPGC